MIHEGDYADLPWDGAVERLRQALRFDTTGYMDTSRVKYDEFDRFHDFLRASYPRVFEEGECREIGHSLLIRLPGEDGSLKPGLLMAHQDVVPVVPGTQQNWKHGPFSGDLAEGYVWGRGAMDIKQMLMGILEAAEYHLNHGRRLQRTLYLAFGEDEETRSVGARALSDLLKNEGVELEFVLDEGAGDVLDAADYGAPGTLACTIGTYEKGYADMKLSVRSRGGHSSNPFHGTSLGILARAIAAIVDHPPQAVLSGAARRAIEILRPHITEEPMRTWAQDMDAHREEILGWFKGKESLYHQVQTTVAPTMIQGGSQAGNVMPQDMEAVINFRLAPPDTPQSLMDRCRSLVDDDVELSYVQEIGPSAPSLVDAPAFLALNDVLTWYFDRLLFIPVQNKGATDARWYEQICRCVMRFGPFLEEEAVSAEGVHGTNERISVKAYEQGVRVLTRFIEKMCL